MVLRLFIELSLLIETNTHNYPLIKLIKNKGHILTLKYSITLATPAYTVEQLLLIPKNKYTKQLIFVDTCFN